MPSRERIAEVLERRKITQERNKAYKSSLSATPSTSFASSSAPVVPEPMHVAVPLAAPIKGVLKHALPPASSSKPLRKQIAELEIEDYSEDAVPYQKSDKYNKAQDSSEEEVSADEYDKHYQSYNAAKTEERKEDKKEERKETTPSEVEGQVKRGRGRPPSSKKKEAEEDSQPQQPQPEIRLRGLPSLLKHPKISGTNSIEFASTAQTICEEFLDRALDTLKSIDKNKEAISGDDVLYMINMTFANGEKDLIEQTFILPQAFTHMLSTKLQQQGLKIKRDAVYLLQVFTETYLLKLIHCADLIASSSKRLRINATDLSIAHHIRSL